MTLKSTPTRYGAVAIVLHWSAALLILMALASGFAVEAIGREAHNVLRVHAVTGLFAGLLTLVRIAWFWLADTKPAPAPDTQPVSGFVARLVHVLMIVVPLGMTASGIGMMVLSGAGAQLLSDAPGLLPQFETVRPRVPHGIGARALVAMIALHTSAALYHQLALRDRLMQRMWFARRPRRSGKALAPGA